MDTSNGRGAQAGDQAYLGVRDAVGPQCRDCPAFALGIQPRERVGASHSAPSEQQIDRSLIGVALRTSDHSRDKSGQGHRCGVTLERAAGNEPEQRGDVHQGRTADQETSAAPGILTRILHQASFHGVVPHVADQGHQVLVSLDRQAPEPILEHVPDPTVLAVEPSRVPNAEPLGNRADRLTRSPQDEMDVVGHQTIGEHDTAGRLSGLIQRVQESLVVLVLEEDGVTVDAAHHHVVDLRFRQLPSLTWHVPPPVGRPDRRHDS